MIKIEFPSDNKPLAGAIGRALCEYSENDKKTPDTVEGKPAIRRIDDGKAGSQNEGEGAGNEPAKDATAQDGSTQEKSKSSATAAVDTKGVEFDATYCGKAKEPFYASGTNKGQWKKRKGVTDEEYSAWYVAQLTNVAPTGETKEDAPLDTSAAFGGQENQNTTVEVPKDCGAFMGWISGQQAANHLNQHDITDAYAKLGLQVTDLFPPNDAQTIAGHINKLFVELGGLE